MSTTPPRPHKARPAPLAWLSALIVTAAVAATLGVRAAEREPRRVVDLRDHELEGVIAEALLPLTSGHAVPKDHAAVVADPRGSFARLIYPNGRFESLSFRLDRRAEAVAIPPEGYAVLRDIRRQLFVVHHDGRFREVFDE
ncbi:MAG: hypothetical protein AAF800_11345 [Planctomycetota bacterium]